MRIWVDADACPKVIKEILFRLADRRQLRVLFVANAWLHLPNSAYIEMIQVENGPDIADNKIAEDCEAEDLVITADIPLAVRVVKKGARALDPRGTLYDSSNIGPISDMRDFMSDLRGSGIETGGPKNFTARDSQNFANALDTCLAKHG